MNSHKIGEDQSVHAFTHSWNGISLMATLERHDFKTLKFFRNSRLNYPHYSNLENLWTLVFLIGNSCEV